MKNTLKFLLQKVLGYEKYLYFFSLYVIQRLPKLKNEKEFLFFRDMISGNGLILDIGANIGAMTYHLAKTHPNNEIHSFEPIDENLKTIKKIIARKRLSNVFLHKIALGEKNDNCEFIIPIVKNVKMQGLCHVKHESIDDYNKGKSIVIPMRSLDSLELVKTKSVLAIKIDVENYEYHTFKGGEKTIKRDKPIIYCELWDNENRNKCFKLMNEYAYDIKILMNTSLIDFDSNKHKTQNFFFIPKKSPLRK